MVEDKEKIRDIYRVINSLGVFGEAPYFKCIVFSDTILVYSNVTEGKREASQLIMFMCEFAQDLFHKLISRDMHFRAILTYGDFEHDEMENIEAFYGPTLVRTYRQESQIHCMGLFIDNALIPDCDIFHTTQYSKDLSYVHLMQTLEHLSVDAYLYPLHGEYIAATNMQYFNAPWLVYLRNISKHMNDANLPASVRSKYVNTWQMIRSRHFNLLNVLERYSFDFNEVCKLDWTDAISRAEIGDL
jgi:hypothetical protein